MNRLPNSIDSTDHKVFVIEESQNSNKKNKYSENELPNQTEKLSMEFKQKIKQQEEKEAKISSKERKAVQDLLKAWEFELQRTYEHRPSPCYPINPFTRRLINPYEFYDTMIQVYNINQNKEYHIDIPPIVNIFAYDRKNVFETYEHFVNRLPRCREKLRDYFVGKQLRFENNEWLNIPPIPLTIEFLTQSMMLAEQKYKPPIINAKEILEQEKNIIIIPKLIQKTSKEQLFRLLDRYPEELKYFTPLEAQFFGFTKEQGEELVKVYSSKDKKLIKQFRDKILKREQKLKEQKGGKNWINDSGLYLLPFF